MKSGCPICSDNSAGYALRPRNRFGRIWRYCFPCDLYFTEPPSRAELEEFYYSRENVGRSRNPVRWVLSCIRAWHQKRYITGVLGVNNGHMLDYGSGNGALVRAFGKWDSAEGYEYGDHDYPPYQVKLVTLSHVLEHMTNPVLFLHDIRNYTDYLFVEVPYATRCKRSFHLEHITNYSPHSLCAILEKSGFSVRNMKVLWWPTIGVVIRCVARGRTDLTA